LPRRRNGQELVENEERVIVAALRLVNMGRASRRDDVRFWVKDIQSVLAEIDPAASVDSVTINRILNRFVVWGWVYGAWETADPADPMSSRPRLYFRLTKEGLAAGEEVVRTKRATLPAWALYPEQLLGLDASPPPELPAAIQPARRRASSRA